MSAATCAHCGAKPAPTRWYVRACADGGTRRWMRLCEPCDQALNRMVLEYFNTPDAGAKLAAYEAAE